MMDFAVNFPLLTVVVSLMAAVICSVLPWKAARALAVTVISACLCMKRTSASKCAAAHSYFRWGLCHASQSPGI